MEHVFVHVQYHKDKNLLHAACRPEPKGFSDALTGTFRDQKKLNDEFRELQEQTSALRGETTQMQRDLTQQQTTLKKFGRAEAQYREGKIKVRMCPTLGALPLMSMFSSLYLTRNVQR